MISRTWSRLHNDGSVGRPAFVHECGLWDDRQLAAAQEVGARLDEVDLVRLVYCDPHGLARSKTLAPGTFRTVLRNGMDFSPGPFIFDTGHAVAVDFLAAPDVGVDEILGAGDFVVVPDPLTFQTFPHDGPRVAWVLGDEYLRDGSEHPLASRNVLRQVCGRYASRGATPVVGLEVEWYLTRRLGGPPGNAGNGFGRQAAAPAVEALNAGYQFNLDTCYDSLAAVVDPLATLLVALGLPLRSMEHESGPGQVETTFEPMTALDAADAMLLFRTLVKQFCARRGYHASFMSLPRIDGFDPSGWHLHQSVMDSHTGRNLFAPAAGAAGISPAGRAYLAGLLGHASELCLLSVPTVNGYRRLGVDFPLSPTRVGWSFENRSVMVRVLGGDSSTHLENRVGEPCANPYLAIASQLHAGLEGLAADADPGPPVAAEADPGLPVAAADAERQVGAGDRAAAAANLPQSLGEALAAFRAGRAAELLGKPLTSCLTKLKESELARFDTWRAVHQPPAGEVSEWEHREYFETY